MTGSRRTSLVDDAAALAALGHRQELQRNFSMLSMLGLAFAILNTWTALSASLTLALPSGGPSAVVWGLIVAGVFNLTLGASMAEFLSAYPTAGGQYHWAALISPPGWSRVRNRCPVDLQDSCTDKRDKRSFPGSQAGSAYPAG